MATGDGRYYIGADFGSQHEDACMVVLRRNADGSLTHCGDQWIGTVNDKPRCAVCKRPVDEVESWRDETKLEPETVFEAHCHGQVEIVRLKDREIVEMNTRTLFVMEAFR